MTDLPLLQMQNFGTETGVPLLIVHGLFGSGRNWRALARHLAKSRWVVTVDMRNHGSSFWNDSNTYDDLANDLAAVVQHLGGTADVLGHSMGGKAAMVLALKRPDLVGRLIIADIAPVGYEHSQTPNIDIMQALPISDYDRRSQAQDALEAATGDAGLGAFFAQSLSFEDGKAEWLLNLSALKANMDAIIGFPAMDGAFAREALFIRGGASDYVSDETESEVRRLFPHFKLATIDGAGHWLHAEKPREFLKIVDEYLT